MPSIRWQTQNKFNGFVFGDFFFVSYVLFGHYYYFCHHYYNLLVFCFSIVSDFVFISHLWEVSMCVCVCFLLFCSFFYSSSLFFCLLCFILVWFLLACSFLGREKEDVMFCGLGGGKDLEGDKWEDTLFRKYCMKKVSI